jgi:hypothetical protein
VPTAAENGVESGPPDYISGGSITVSMTWITPLDAMTSAVINGAGGELGEGGVGRSENRERSLALEDLDQAGSLEGSGQGGEGAGLDRGLDDVLVVHLGLGGSGDGEEGRGDGGESQSAKHFFSPGVGLVGPVV